MKNKAVKDSDVLQNIKKNIADAEQKRKELRFTYNLNVFAQGNLQVLNNDEFFEGLKFLLTHSCENTVTKNQIYNRLGDGALSKEISIRERALSLLSSIAKIHLHQNEKSILIIISRSLCNWLEFESEVVAAFPVLSKRLENIFVWFLEHSCWCEAEEVIGLLGRIQSGKLKKSMAIKDITDKTLHNLAKKAIVEKLTDEYLTETDQQHLLVKILQAIGSKAALYLLNRIIHSPDRIERLALLDLISTFGDCIIPVLEECLEKDPPWAVVRNIICIVSKIEDEANFGIVRRYYGHPDQRVQIEMIGCVLKLSGPAMKQRLIEGLSIVHDRLKIYILRLLVEPADNDENVLSAVLEMADRKSTFPEDSKEDLLLAITAALKAFPCERAIEQLKKMQDECRGKKEADNLLFHIEEALKVVEPIVRHNIQFSKNMQDVVSFDNDPVQQQIAFEKVRKTENDIQALVQSGKMEQAGRLIYDQGIAAAKMKDFSVAELLRDRLLEINSMAFSEVIQLGEFIDEQKSTSITSHHLETWSELYEELTTEEFNQLYYSMRQENYHKGDTIVRSGEIDNSLFFLNSGYISLCCNVNGKEIFLKRMQPSHVLGGEQFFSPSVWTVTLRALSEVEVHILDHKAFLKIIEEYPGIGDKLRRYCQQHGQVPDLLKMSGDDRREYPRHSTVLHARSILLDNFGIKGKRSFKCEIFDISRQGLAFTIRISNSSNARLLLGRHIMTTIVIGDDELPQQNGVIVGVRLFEPIMQDYSIHVKLFKKIDKNLFESILSASGLNINQLK
ncbi:MAG: cyclic nucleotide-binding domain-containing protein [Desulforhopalus sp.]